MAAAQRVVEEALARAEPVREGKWTQSLAVGGRDFVETIQAKPGIRAKGRRFSRMDGESSPCEPQVKINGNASRKAAR